VSLAVRLLLALGFVAAFVTALVGLSARDVSRRQAERGFAERIDAATMGAQDELAHEAQTLAELLVPLCKHDTFVDRALLELERVDGKIEALDGGRTIAWQRIVREQRKALRLDALTLATGAGAILASSELELAGGRSAALAKRLRQTPGIPRLVQDDDDGSIEVHCTRTSRGVVLALVGRRAPPPTAARCSVHSRCRRSPGSRSPRRSRANRCSKR
jgi:hypothetical protein